MHQSPFVLGLASVFAGLTTLLIAAGVAAGEVFVLFVALPLGITTVVMWLHGTGRLEASVRGYTTGTRFAGPGRSRNGRATVGQRTGNRRRTRRTTDRRSTAGRSAGDGPFTDGRGPFTGGRDRVGGEGNRFGGARRRRTAGESERTRGRTRVVQGGMSAGEAAQVLGVEPDADEGTVKAAYREKVKRHHPDVDGGDESAFKRVTEAYERLS